MCYHYLLCPCRKLYHPNNAQLGMAIMRAGLTNWHAGNIEVGHSMIDLRVELTEAQKIEGVEWSAAGWVLNSSE